MWRLKRQYCDVCKKEFTSKFCFDLHCKTHLKNAFLSKRFECAQCGRTFKEQKNFKIHLKLHQKSSSSSAPTKKGKSPTLDATKDGREKHVQPKDNSRRNSPEQKDSRNDSSPDTKENGKVDEDQSTKDEKETEEKDGDGNTVRSRLRPRRAIPPPPELRGLSLKEYKEHRRMQIIQFKQHYKKQQQLKIQQEQQQLKIERQQQQQQLRQQQKANEISHQQPEQQQQHHQQQHQPRLQQQQQPQQQQEPPQQQQQQQQQLEQQPQLQQLQQQPPTENQIYLSNSNNKYGKCEMCSISFTCFEDFHRHTKSQHSIFDGERRICHICGTTMPVESKAGRTFKEHLRVHFEVEKWGPKGLSGTSSFICGFCGEGFPSPVTLETHAQVHFQSLPYHCDECNRDFSYVDTFRQHQEIVHRRRNFYCEYCHKYYRIGFGHVCFTGAPEPGSEEKSRTEVTMQTIPQSGDGQHIVQVSAQPPAQQSVRPTGQHTVRPAEQPVSRPLAQIPLDQSTQHRAPHPVRRPVPRHPIPVHHPAHHRAQQSPQAQYGSAQPPSVTYTSSTAIPRESPLPKVTIQHMSQNGIVERNVKRPPVSQATSKVCYVPTASKSPTPSFIGRNPMSENLQNEPPTMVYYQPHGQKMIEVRAPVPKNGQNLRHPVPMVPANVSPDGNSPPQPIVLYYPVVVDPDKIGSENEGNVNRYPKQVRHFMQPGAMPFPPGPGGTLQPVVVQGKETPIDPDQFMKKNSKAFPLDKSESVEQSPSLSEQSEGEEMGEELFCIFCKEYITGDAHICKAPADEIPDNRENVFDQSDDEYESVQVYNTMDNNNRGEVYCHVCHQYTSKIHICGGLRNSIEKTGAKRKSEVMAPIPRKVVKRSSSHAGSDGELIVFCTLCQETTPAPHMCSKMVNELRTGDDSSNDESGPMERGADENPYIYKRRRDSYRCDVCQVGLSTEGKLLRHMEMHANEARHYCQFCEQMTTRTHLCRRVKDFPYECEYCGWKFRYSHPYNKHIKKYHSEITAAPTLKKQSGRRK